MWSEHDVRRHGEGRKFVQPPHGKPIVLEYSSFAVDGQPGLGVVVYTPATPADMARVEKLIASRKDASGRQAAVRVGRRNLADPVL